MIANVNNVICEEPGCGHNVLVVPDDGHEPGKNRRSFSGTCANCGTQYSFELRLTTTAKDTPPPTAEEAPAEEPERRSRR